jgi:hypothetical protein
MVQPAVWILYEMVTLVLENSIGTLIGLLRLFAQFVASLSLVMGSGFGGFVLGFVILGLVGILLIRFLLTSGKTIAIMLAIGILLLYLIYMGMLLY